MKSLFYLISFLAGGFLFFVAFVLYKKKAKDDLFDSLKMTLFSVKMPRYEESYKDSADSGQQNDFKRFIESMEQFYSHFLHLKKSKLGRRPFRVALEIASEVGGEDISFYVAVPNYLAPSFEKFAQGAYSGALVERKPQDYTIFERQGKSAGSFLLLKRPFYFSLNTYKNLSSDPLMEITNALGKIKPDEGAAMQIILTKNDLKIKSKAERILSQASKKGESIESAIHKASRSFLLDWIEDIFNVFWAKGADKMKEEESEKMKESSVSQEQIDSIRKKIQKPCLRANVRLIACAPQEERAEIILDALEGAFAQFSGVENEFKTIKIKKIRRKKFFYDFSFRNFKINESIILNLEEISSIFHFPLPHLAPIGSLQWVRVKEVAPPNELPKAGEMLLGKAIFRGDEKPVWVASKEDRRRHFYIVGQTGTGKSSLLQEMIRQDIEKGEGVGVIDPHGDLVEKTLANIPPERMEDVVLFEPFDMSRVSGLNMLEWTTPEQKDFAVSEMITILVKLFPPEMTGPMFEHYMRNAMLALMADNEDPGTLVEIPRIFTEKEFMEERLQKVKDPVVKSFWMREWSQTTGQTRSDMLGYVVSKVGRFVENEMMRNIIGQSKSSFNLEDIMDKKKIFLANLSKGMTGEMNSSLLGLILVSKMQIAALRRGRMPEEERKDFYLYIDEFQNFTTDSIATILSEARKYKLNLILAHQFIPQLTEQIRDAVVGNVGNMACYRIGATDAEFLEKQFQPEFSKHDLLNLDNFNFVLKMMIENNISSAFKVKAEKPKPIDNSLVEEIKRLSKLKYSIDKSVVEKDILERSRLGVE